MPKALRPLAFVAALLLAVLIGAGIANERKDAVGLIAIPVYAAVLLAGISAPTGSAGTRGSTERRARRSSSSHWPS